MTDVAATTSRASLPAQWLRLREASIRASQPDGIPPAVRRWIVVLFTLGFLAAVIKMLVRHMITMPDGVHHWNDSYIYLGAASDFIDHPSHLYDSAHLQVVRSWAQRTFVHPPSGVLPYLPLVPVLRAFGMPVAASVWSLVDTVALFGGLTLLARKLGLSWLVTTGAIMLIGLAQPARWEIESGQINGLVIALLMLAVVRMPRPDSGVLMGLALAFKPVSVIVLLVPLLRRQPWITVLAVITLALVNVPIVFLIGISVTLFYVGHVLPFFAGYALHDPNNISLPNVLQTFLGGGALPRHRLFNAPVPGGIEAVVVLWVLRIAVFALWLRATIERRLGAALAVALAMATVPFLSSTIWPHYLLYAMPLAFVTLSSKHVGIRAGATAALLAFLWQSRSDALWVGIIILWVTAAVFVALDLGWRLPRAVRGRETAALRARV
jgi:hypothetical protein